MSHSLPVSEIVAFMNQFAPRTLAEEWDNVGLLVGHAESDVSAVMTCLTLTPDVAAEAIERDVDLIVSHHPVMFRPIQTITAADPQGKMLLDLISAGIAVFCPHTAYDSAIAGINQQLAEMLELQEIAPLRTYSGRDSVKIVCSVPAANLESVQQALWKEGSGYVGDYSRCSFSSDGTGTFLGGETTSPAVGSAGQLERVPVIRLEVVCPKTRLSGALSAMIAAHPYEEPAYDVYPLQSDDPRMGSGRCGKLREPLTLEEFNERVKAGLGIRNLQYVGELSMPIRRVAVACGAAAEFQRDGRRLGCDVLLTGEARFHDCLEARQAGMALVLPGHYATERPAMERLAEILTSQFASLTVFASVVESDPIQWDSGTTP